MLSLLERDLLTEVLGARFPGTNRSQIESSINNAEAVVVQAAQATVNQQSSQQPSNPSSYHQGYNPLPVINEQQEGWKINTGGGGGISTPFGGSQINFGGGISFERGFFDQARDVLGGAVKPFCQATATAVYNSAIGAARSLDPISQAAAVAVAKAIYDKAMKQC